MKIESDEVLAYQIDHELVCEECASDDEKQGAMENVDNLLLRNEYEGSDNLWYCDRCRERI